MRSASRKAARKKDEPSNEYDLEPFQETHLRNSKPRGTATVYDAVAGRVGSNGFLTDHKSKPSAPEEVLLRRLNAPDEISFDYYEADKKLGSKRRLPDSDMTKSLHAYAADFYTKTNDPQDKSGFRSFDETALLAMAILLEEASKEALGENGDMVFTEPQSRDQRMPRSALSQYQVLAKVEPKQVIEYESPSSSEEVDTSLVKPRKRRRRHLYQARDD